jgi:hypothetical protein
VDAKPGDRPKAVGYQRGTPGSARARISSSRLAERGTQAGYAVRGVLTDPGHPGAPHPAGFLALVRDVREHGDAAVLVSSPAQLADAPQSRAWMTRMIAHVGAELVVLPVPAVGVVTVPAQRISGHAR